MKLKTKMRYTAALVAAALSVSTAPMAYGATVTIDNPGFEDGFNDWDDGGSPSISEFEHSGEYAAKVSTAGAEVEQTVEIEANTDYVLSAYIAGTAKLGVVVGDASESITTIGGSQGTAEDDYELVTVSFNSGSATSARVFGIYVDSEARFDDFALESVESTDTDTDTESGEQFELEISDAFDDDSGYWVFTADNVIDDDTSWASRWAAYADGAAVNLTAQLAAVSDVTQVGIAWADGDTNIYTFEIYARATTSGTDTWTKVFDGVSSGTDTAGDMEIYDVTGISAQQVRIKVIENSKADGWASIAEVKIYSDTDNSTNDLELGVMLLMMAVIMENSLRVKRLTMIQAGIHVGLHLLMVNL